MQLLLGKKKMKSNNINFYPQYLHTTQSTMKNCNLSIKGEDLFIIPRQMFLPVNEESEMRGYFLRK